MKNLFSTLILSLLALGCTQQQPESLRLATFNIRYDNSGDGPNSWPHRKDSICAFIHRVDPDIIDMQEVLHHQLEVLKTGLPEYTVVGVGREDGKTAGEYAPIFFKQAKYTLLDQNTFWLCEKPDSVGMVGWDAALTRIATWVKLQDKKTGQILMVVNTHFDNIGTEARRNSALLIIEKIKEIVGTSPAILTGDFNVSEDWDAYKTITNNEFILKDAHKVAGKRTGVDFTYHNFGKIPAEKCEKIDFIFVTPQIRVISSYIPFSQLNDTLFLSDHNPEIVELEIEKS